MNDTKKVKIKLKRNGRVRIVYNGEAKELVKEGLASIFKGTEADYEKELAKEEKALKEEKMARLTKEDKGAQTITSKSIK